MVDIASVVNEIAGARPADGLDGCWIWSLGRFHYALALTSDGGYAMQLNSRDEFDPELTYSALGFARACSEAVVAAAPFAALEGFTSPSQNPFDVVGVAMPGVHRHQSHEPALRDLTYAVFPAFRCEFSGTESQKEAANRFDRVLDAADLHRTPKPWIRIRFVNAKTGARSLGQGMIMAKVSLLLTELRDLENADGAFVEIENFRHETCRVSWAGAIQIAHGDDVREVSMTELLAWAHRFVFEGTDSAP
jgi:hypothetical protein